MDFLQLTSLRKGRGESRAQELRDFRTRNNKIVLFFKILALNNNKHVSYNLYNFIGIFMLDNQWNPQDQKNWRFDFQHR